MSEGQKPDPRRRKKSVPHSTNFKIAPGKSDVGYSAGPLYGCYGHRTFAHKPCLLHLTKGELSCPMCAAGLEPEWRGYVPIWDRDFALRYALINETYFESVDMIPHRSQIVLTRALPQKSPLVIRAADKLLVRELPAKPPWTEPVDMCAICRLLWKDAAIDAWWASTNARSVGATTVADALDPAKFGDMYKAAADRVNRMNGVPTPNEEFVEAVKRGGSVPPPSPNGKPKPKG